MDVRTKKMVKELKNKGFDVKRRVPTVKKTFEVPEDTLEKFKKAVYQRDMKIKDAIEEALEDWVEKEKFHF